NAGERRRTTEVILARPRSHELPFAAAGITVDHGRCTDEQHLLRGIVGTRRPVRPAPDARLDDCRILADERREDAAVVDERGSLRGNRDHLRHDGVTARERLRGGGRLPRLLRYWPLVDAD